MASLVERLLGAWNVLRGVRRATDTSGGIDGLPDRLGTAPDPDGDLRTRSLTWEVFKHYTHLEPDRYSVYSDMDEMFLHVLVSSAMEAYIEDALQEDVRTGKVIAIKAANPLVVQAIDELFKRIELEDRISGDLWAIGKYGDYFNLLMYSKGEHAGIYDARPLEPRVVHRHENLRRVLTGFTIGDQNEVNQLRDQEPKYKPWDVVHFRIRRFRPIDPYGTPFFINCRLIYKTLKLMEEQMAMYRMKMHPDRLIFKVWCGNQSPDESLRTMRKWKKALDRVQAINHDTGRFVSESSVWGQLEDIVWPVHNNDDQSGVEKFPGSSNSSDIVDVMYMRDLLFAGTRMPKAYMGFEDSQGYRASDTLSQQSVKFARGVKRIRRPLLQGLIRLCKIHLELRGINTSSPENAFELVMTPVNYLEDAQKSEYFAKRFETVNYMMDMGEKMAAALGINLQLWASYVMTEFAGFDDATVAKLMSPVQPDGAGIPNMIFSPGTTQITYEQREKLREAVAGNEGLQQLVDKLAFYEGAIPSPDRCMSSEVFVEAPTSTSSDEKLFREAEEASNKAFEKTAQDERNKVSRLREELLSIAKKAANGGNCDD